VTTFDSRQFRDVLGHVPTSVVVVTGIDSDGIPQGITIGSFVSVSLEPPLVGFLPGTQSKTWNSLKGTAKFCVNVLAENQADVCWKFAKESDDRFADVEWSPSLNGAPAIAGSLAHIDCDLDSDVLYGDHFFVVGRVTHLHTPTGVSQNAMAFYRGKVVEVEFPE
jgi:hypothetical protein